MWQSAGLSNSENPKVLFNLILTTVINLWVDSLPYLIGPIMKTQKYIYWQDEDMFLGYLEAYPDYWTQGETLAELEENLLDLYTELTSGTIPCVRKVAELQIA